MADLDLTTLGRKLLLIAAILSALVIGEMLLVTGEAASSPPDQQVRVTRLASGG
jgi:hypothetical protein